MIAKALAQLNDKELELDVKESQMHYLDLRLSTFIVKSV